MNYADNIFKMLEVEPYEKFGIVGLPVDYKFFIDNQLKVYHNRQVPECRFGIEDILNGNNVISKIKSLTKEDQLAIDYGKAAGFQWLVKNQDGSCHYYYNKPERKSTYWHAADNGGYCHIKVSFIRWGDEEPYFIGDGMKW